MFKGVVSHTPGTILYHRGVGAQVNVAKGASIGDAIWRSQIRKTASPVTPAKRHVENGG
jgi:hypothetical protein